MRLKFVVAMGRMVGDRKLGNDEIPAVEAKIVKAFEEIHRLMDSKVGHQDQTKH
jgi:hypothetical protein